MGHDPNMGNRSYFDDDDQDFEDVAPKAPHSLLGIASFVTVLAAALLLCGLVVLAGLMGAANAGDVDEHSPQAILLGLLFLGGLCIDFVGIALGVAGACQARRNKIFAWLGLGIGGTVLFAMVCLIGLGMLMG
jgi:hypothetical protein